MRGNRTRQWNVGSPAIRAWGRLPLPNIGSMGGESGPQGIAIADSERRPLILRSSFSCAQPTEDRFQGHKMNIDLDSWEAGYTHGQQGGRPRCAIELDQVSYLSGFCHGRAWREQSRTKRPPLRALERRAHEPPQGRAGGSRSQTSSSDEASVRGSHQDRQCGMLHFLLPGGSHPHMKRRFTAA